MAWAKDFKPLPRLPFANKKRKLFGCLATVLPARLVAASDAAPLIKVVALNIVVCLIKKCDLMTIIPKGCHCTVRTQNL